MLLVARLNGLATRPGRLTTLTRTIVALSIVVSGAMAGSAQTAQPDPAKAAPAKARPEPSKPRLGLLVNDPQAFQGYTLLAPTNSTNTYLIDMQGRVVQTWKSDCLPGLGAYLLENGNLLRTGQIRNPPFFGGGTGGRIQEFTWDGKIVWDFTYYSNTHLPNHDICKLPNGNVLMIVWEKKAPKEAIAAGRRPETVGKDHLLADCILEVQPTGKTSGKIVWEWHSWDHLIQDFDLQQANYGEVGAHPELLDLNFGTATIAAMVAKPAELEKLRSIGYVGGAGRRPQFAQPDWLHINAVAYDAGLDQIMLSVYEFNEIWILDHGTRTAEAAAHKGGRHGKGGDLLYRWGNPRAYRAGTVKDQKLFGQHNSHWIENGFPGQGHVLIFNNGMQRTGGAYSTVDEIVLPVDEQGHYERAPGKAFGPDTPVWSYVAPRRIDFYAPFISGAQRLANGNTLICSGTNGTIFEVTPKNEIVWKYVNPDRGSPPFGGPPPGGGAPFGPAPRLGQILSSFLQGVMNFTTEQKKQLEAAEKQIAEELGKLLTEEQKTLFQQRPRGFGDFPPAGQLMSAAVETRLKLTAEQKKQLAAVQKEADGKLDVILNDAQKKQLRSMQDMARGFQAGGPRGGFRAGFGPPGGGGLFRAPRYDLHFAGLAGKDLKPGKTIEEILEMNLAKQSQDKGVR
jgi:hypothetical protein